MPDCDEHASLLMQSIIGFIEQAQQKFQYKLVNPLIRKLDLPAKMKLVNVLSYLKF
jgi:hypothetical protein